MPFERSPTVERVIACAIDVHKSIGPGLLESVYEECLGLKLDREGVRYRRQVEVPIFFEGQQLRSTFRLDLLVENCVVVELKSVERILPVHVAQTLTYLKLSGRRHGLLINFNVEVLRSGLRSFVNSRIGSGGGRPGNELP